MSYTDEFVISGPQKKYAIKFDSLGKYLFNCLKKKNSDEVFGIDVSHNQTLTCGSLLERSIKLSMSLKDNIIEKGDVVALICENTLDSLVCLLALMYLGISVNLINSSYTIRELKHSFSISKPKCIISTQSSINKVLALQKEQNFIKTVISIDNLDDDLKEIEDVNTLINKVTTDIEHFQPTDTDVNDTVVICLSSGTTGMPKCVELTNKNFISVIDYILDERYTNTRSTDITVSVLPLVHIYGVIINLAAIVASMKLITIKSFKSELFLETIQKYKVTKLFTVPPLLQFLATNDKVKSFDLSSVKDILVGGAPLTQAVYKKASETLSFATIRELYGATELTGFCTMQRVFDNVRCSGSLISNILLKVIDLKSNKPLPAHKTGELLIKGNILMKGYLNNPIETKNAVDSEGFYRTGDIGYCDENGNVFICDRLKELIKYKAFQVSPVELENVILEHPAIDECAVFGRPDDKAGELATAFVILRDGFNATEEEIVNFMSEVIAPHKGLHGGVVFVKEIPKNPTGKILRKELRQLYNSIKS